MKNFYVFTDSTSDVEKNYREELDFGYLKMAFRVEEKDYDADLEWSGLASKDFYNTLRQGNRATTNQILTTEVEKKFEEALKPINEKLEVIDTRIDKLDKNECKNYLTEFLEDIKNGVPKSDIQIQRATEVYDHYINDLHLNTYIHDSWEKYMKGDK